MCGILAITKSSRRGHVLRRTVVDGSHRLRHRGPDWSGYHVSENTGTGLGHERLAIIDPLTGDQPLYDRANNRVAIVNGEIYNHQEIREQYSDYSFHTNSDSEVVLPLYDEHGIGFPSFIDGMFAVVIYDEKTTNMVVARDHIGIISLYYGRMDDGAIAFASEMKALLPITKKCYLFPPGHVYSSSTDSFTKWYDPSWLREPKLLPVNNDALSKIRTSLECAVIKRTISDVPWGVLLSGGLDSSLVASITSRHYWKVQNRPVKTFCVGFEDSSDIVHAQKVAYMIGSEHYTMQFSVQDALDALPDVINHMESYVKSTIRSAVPQYLMARRIKALGIKMVLTGEGADECFGGYEQSADIRDGTEFHSFLVGSLLVMHRTGIARNNKIPMAHGLETRVPFLDKDFLDIVMHLDPAEKYQTETRPEKYLLRTAFDSPHNPYLPTEVLWRKKLRFSGGVGKSWYKSLASYVDEVVSDKEIMEAHARFPVNTPRDKEEYYYRHLFEQKFPGDEAASTVPKSWMEEITLIQKDMLASN